MVARTRRRAKHRPRRPPPRRAIGDDVRQHYRVLLEYLGGELVRTLGVTSCTAGEGTSTVAAHLAMSAAASNRRVVLVDANLARPAVESRFCVPAAPGLADVLLDGAPLETALQPSGFDGLSLLTADGGEPERVFAATNLGDMLEGLRTNFDLVVFDLPSRLHREPALRLAGFLEGVLLVIEAGGPSSELAQETRLLLTRARVHVVGAVLNKAGR